MPKNQKTKTVSPEQQRINFERLQRMMKNPEKNLIVGKLKELEALLTGRDQAITLEEAAKIMDTSERGIWDMRANYRSPDTKIEIFSETEGKLEIWYIKIKKKKQP
ncbi:MAG: hypothetical protein Q8N37_00595 [bacterium]|nr:hypothetical protein [bacterium]